MKYLSLTVFACLVSANTQASDITSPCFNCPDLNKVTDASTFSDSDYYSDVYNAINNGQSQQDIKSALSAAISVNHKQLQYSEVWSALTKTDEDPNNPNNVLLIYKGTSIDKWSNGSGSQSTNPDNWNREHVWAKSHGFKSSSLEAYTDIHHLRPSDISINSSRSNLDFDNSDNSLPEAPENRYDSDSFEPRGAVKGDVARMVLYMDTRYEGLDATPDLTIVNQITSSGEPLLGKLCKLLEWHEADPVDAYEANRNNTIYEYQGNRNPFIDHPEWVEAVFPKAACADVQPPTEPTDPTEPTEPTDPVDPTDPVEPTEPVSAPLILSAAYDGPLPGGLPKGVEIFVTQDIADLSVCGFGSANNGGGSDGQEFTFPAESANKGDYIYLSSEAVKFEEFMGFAPNYTSGAANVNGDDALELYCNDVVVDVLGDINTDGTGQAWEYMDGWAARKANSTVNGGVYNADEWVFSGKNKLDGETSNATADTPIPVQTFTQSASLFISGVIDGPLSGGVPKAIEIFIGTDIADLSKCGIGSANNGGGSDGEEFSFPVGTSATAGSFLYVASESTGFTNFFGFAPDYTTGAASINGDDAIELFCDGEVVDVYGDINTDGSGQPWEYLDGWAYRINGSSANDGAFEVTNWILSGKNALDGSADNAAANTPFPIGTFGTIGEPEPEPDLLGQCLDEATFINIIQGNGFESPFQNETKVIEATVTASVPAIGGFFVQEQLADQDTDSLTSEGIFVSYDQAGEFPMVGDIVRLLGNVEESYGKTMIKATKPLLVCGSDSLSPINITLPFSSDEQRESIEGMYVNFEQDLTVTDNYNLGRYGEVTLSSERLFVPTNLYLPGSEEVAALASQNKLNKVLLDDAVNGSNPDVIRYPSGGLSASNTLRTGDKVSALEGVIDYSYGNYRVIPSQEPTFIHDNVREATPSLETGNLRVASFNVLNYFNGDGLGEGFPTSRGADSLEEFDRQRSKILNAITAMDADIIGLLEVENDDYSETSAIQDIVDGLNAIAPAGKNYMFVNPGIDQLGTDKIKVALIYDANAVSEIGTAVTLTDFPFEYHNRPPLAQSFRSLTTGEKLTVAINHFRSKGCSSSGGVENEDKGDGQGCYNLRRVQAAEAVTAWLATSPTGVEDEDTLIMGDLNAYTKEDPIKTIIDAGYTNLIETLKGAGTYSYSYRGESGTIDHALASNPLAAKVVDIAEWHINTDEPRILDYNVEYKSEDQLVTMYDSEPYRASDHDPVVIEIEGVTPMVTNTQVIEGVSKFKRWFWWFWYKPQNVFKVEMPEQAASLKVTLEGGRGNADLYLRQGKKPNKRKFDCSSVNNSNDEVCEIEMPRSGDWFIGVKGRFFHNVTMTIETVTPEKID